MRPGKTKQLNISIPEDLVPRIKQAADEDKRSVSNFLAVVIEDGLDARDELKEG